MIKYNRFSIEKYKAVKDSAVSVLLEPVPIIGVNESGKSSALEAIARFDYRNDALANQKNWKFINRYIPSEDTFTVSAEISYEKDDLETIISNYNDQEKEQINEIINSNAPLILKRNFRRKAGQFLSSYSILDKENDLIEKFSKALILSLPRIFYFDNFLENPFPDSISFQPEYFSNPNLTLTEYQTVIESMFLDSGYDLRSFLQETDESTQDTHLAEINRKVSEKIINEWTKMHLGMQESELGPINEIEIKLSQNRGTRNTLNINIIETFKDSDGTPHNPSMLLSERSLGFRWFFNFSTKKCYGARGEQKFIYLFDEPGSYLHNGAQKVLLNAIKELAGSHPVIFSTHSEFLLDPEIININNIRIVEKKDREIKLVPLSQVNDKKNMGALSTLYNALRTKIPISSTLNQKVLVTEGITDFYFWKMLCTDVVILPGFGAGQNEYLISIAIGTAKKYLAFFDGDTAGEQAIIKYTKYFGDKEAINWKKYLDKDNKNIKLEKLLSASDQKRLLTQTGMKDLKKGITTLFFSQDQETFWNGIDVETKSNIQKNIESIKISLEMQPKNFKYNLT